MILSDRINCPTESQEQRAVFEVCTTLVHKYPELELLYHVPNGGKRDAVIGAKLKAEGVKAGVPDLVLPVARAGYHGLYIELKRQHGGRLSGAQRDWCRNLTRQGYCVLVCRGANEALNMLVKYLCNAESIKSPRL